MSEPVTSNHQSHSHLRALRRRESWSRFPSSQGPRVPAQDPSTRLFARTAFPSFHRKGLRSGTKQLSTDERCLAFLAFWGFHLCCTSSSEHKSSSLASLIACSGSAPRFYFIYIKAERYRLLPTWRNDSVRLAFPVWHISTMADDDVAGLTRCVWAYHALYRDNLSSEWCLVAVGVEWQRSLLEVQRQLGCSAVGWHGSSIGLGLELSVRVCDLHICPDLNPSGSLGANLQSRQWS